MKRRTPLVLQSEATECALACLAMIMGAHGGCATLTQLRRRCAVSLQGLRLAHVLALAPQLGLRARALRLELAELGQLQLPCVLHWNLDHFVVLDRVRRGRCRILDPACGERNLSLAEVSAHFTGVAVELQPEAQFVRQPEPQAPPLASLTGPITGLYPALLRILLLSLALQLFVLLAPFLLQGVVDHVLVSGDRDLLGVLVLGFGGALLLQTAIAQLRGWTLLRLTTQLTSQWSSNLVAHLLRLPMDFFERRHLGDIQSRLSSQAAIQRGLTAGAIETCVDGLLAVTTLLLMLAYSPMLGAVTLVAVAVYLALRRGVQPRAQRLLAQQLQCAARQQSHLLESLRGIQSIRVAGREWLRRADYDNLLAESVNQESRLGGLQLHVGGVQQLLFGAERLLVVWLGARLVLAGEFTAGMLIAYLSYKDQFAARVAGCIDRWMELRSLRVHAERLADLTLTPPEPLPQPGRQRVFAAESGPAGIEIDGVSFRYGDAGPWILEHCRLTVAAGECVALIGASGCGKSTLLKLLLGLLRPACGTVRIAGQELRPGDLHAARSIIGAVLQDDRLFAGTIADNISFFDPDADAARIEGAARLAAIHADIAALPMQYETPVGDMGSALSGGQRQRLLLARALYRRPRILLLDEATSHLDVDRERQVTAAVRALQLTRLIIAHRPETMRGADRLLRLSGGVVTELPKPPARIVVTSP